MKDTPFDTIGDEPVEARIVAWVLGEASAFEAAELERLCEERPELLVFRRRMRALHGLLIEAEAAEKDYSWKLPPEKRKLLDEVLGEEKVIRLETQKERRIRRAGFRAFFAIAACLVLAVVVLQLIHPIWITRTIREPEKKVDFMPMGDGVGGGGVAGGVADADIDQRELNKAVRDQEDKVEERRKVLAATVRTKGIIYKGQDSFYGQSGVDEDQGARSAFQTFNQLEKEQAQLQTQLEILNESNADSRTKANVQEQLALAGERLKEVEVMKDDSREESIKRGLDARDYVDAKRDFETDQQLLQAMKLKQINETITKQMTEDSIVVPEMPPPVESEKGVASLTAPGASGGKAQVAQKLKGGIDIVGGSKFQLDLEQSNAALSQPPTSTAAPAAPTARGGQLASFSLSSNGQAGHKESARQLQPAKQPAERLDTDVAGTPVEQPPVDASQLGLNGVTNGLRSGDQAVDRNSIDAILNNPNRVADGGKTAKGIDSIPPVLADRESRIAGEPNRPPDGAAAVAGALPSWGGHEGKLAEGDEKSGTGTLLGSDSSTHSALEGLGRSNPARTREQTQTVDQMRRNLYTAEGNYSLGKYDDAKKAYEDTLRIDPYNSAARRGLEKISAAKSDYYRAAYDHTRAELLGQVESAWELSVPAEGGIEFFSEAAKDSDPSLITVDKYWDTSVRKQQGGIEYELHTGYSSEYLFRGVDLSPKDKSKPAPADLAELMEEIPASENPYSTFSLNISDASFQVAKAALARGIRPDPASIKPEQFYNAVDYGDPAPASNEPVAATIEQSAHPIIPGRNLVRVALRTGSVGRSAAQPLRLTLLVDQSGSMVREDRRAAMEHALAQLGGLLTKADRVTVIGFSRTPHLLADAMTGDQAAKLGDLVNQTASEGGTNLEEAMKLGGAMAARHQLAGAQNRIVLFTDGAANLGDAKPERLAELVKSFRQKGLAFDIAGIGADGLNDRLLSELARNGNGRYYVVSSENNDSFARQLAGAFRPAAENVKVQVNFNPQRVGKYKLIGFEKDRLKTEDFRNDAVDAAELAAEEAGVAIYQVEPLAEGSGELGEVSVRFRDAASKEMVERTWTIPYDAQATAFDRATPSMQLAGLALLAAEKLKGGPLADAIDFKQLTGPSAFVKQFYGSSPRVAEMLRVIDDLK